MARYNEGMPTYEVECCDLPSLHRLRRTITIIILITMFFLGIILRQRRWLVAADKERRRGTVVRGSLGPDRPRLLPGLLRCRCEESSDGTLFKRNSVR